MVSAWFLPVAFLAGVFVGIVIIALVAGSGTE